MEIETHISKKELDRYERAIYLVKTVVPMTNWQYTITYLLRHEEYLEFVKNLVDANVTQFIVSVDVLL